MGKGYMGRILVADLSSGQCRAEDVSDRVYERFLSGLGLGAHEVHSRMPAGADPLGPDNVLGLVSGLLTGTGSLFTGRWMAVGKSPLTGGWGDANCGGQFSPALKRAGFDGIFITGAAKKPVTLVVTDGKAEIREAADLWGKDAIETEDLLKKAAGNRAQIAAIGPAGEKLSLMAGISNDRGRMAARSGLGAVMGAKKLKAVVVTGTGRIEPHDREAMKSLTERCAFHLKKKMPLPPGFATPFMGLALAKMPLVMAQDGMLYIQMLRKWGTVSMNQASIEMGDSPLMNWKGTAAEFGRDRSGSVNPDSITAFEKKKYHCFSCPLGCGGICSLPGTSEETHKPEYESVLALGGLLMNQDLPSIFRMNELFNRAGMDTISAGSSIAFALECYENGLLTRKDTDGLELTWGNAPAIMALAEKIVRREGIGDLLADGSKVAAEKIGKGAARFAMHAGGQDLPMHDSRLDPGFALHMCAEPTPGRHTVGAFLYYEMYQLWKVVKGLPQPGMFYAKSAKYRLDREKAVMCAANSRYNQAYNGAGLCMFGAFMGASRIPLFDWLNAATGWGWAPEDYMAAGSRIETLRQAFNVREGIDPWKNVANARALGRPPQDHGPNKGRTIDVEPFMKDFWQEMGWERETGRPTAEAMAAAGLGQ
jgi:aldehyde:ferredoxin oxidoreductase